MLSKQKKDKIIAKFKTHAQDTGSPQVQVAILTEEVKELTKHLKEHPLDYSSRRGLIRKVNERRKLLKYLAREDNQAWEKLVKELKIKIPKVREEKLLEELEEEILPVDEPAEVEEVKDDTL
ncbi:MAG: 30S ribosomal protein S15 [Patescibacteria group bacterium]